MYMADKSAIDMFPLTETWEISANYHNMTPVELMYRALNNVTQLMVIDRKGKGDVPTTRKTVDALPGHMWMGSSLGPTHAKIMIIGKMPGESEIACHKNFVGPTGEELLRIMRKYRAPLDDMYVTNVVRFSPPGRPTKLPAYHIADCAPLLVQEIMEVAPEFILLLGADAIKFIFGNKATLSSIRGAMLPMHVGQIGQFPDRFSTPETMQALFDSVMPITVMATQHPAQALREPELIPGLEADIESFIAAVNGGSKPMISLLKTCEYSYIDNVTELTALVDKLIADGITELAMDCEWGGEHYKDGWLRTIQFAWDVGKAAVVILRTAASQQELVFKPDLAAAVAALKKLIDRPGVKLSGQNFRSDALWLEDLGLPVMAHFTYDTMLADHALNESQPHNLTAIALRHTNLGRYDFELESWLKLHPQAKELGYANVPDNLLHKYGATDADAVFRIKQVQEPLFELPEHAGIKQLFYSIIMPANQPIHEMEQLGIAVDTDRMVDLFWKYTERKKQLIADLRNLTTRPGLNPRSYQQKTMLLFGPVEKGGLALTPTKATGKPAKEWSEVLRLPTEEQVRYNPSTDSESLELISQSVPEGCYADRVIELLQDFQTIDQITKNFLKAPAGYTGEDDEGAGDFELDDFDSGLLGHVKNDGRIHTTVSQIKETGRHSTMRPSLQNITKKMEPVYQRIMGYEIPKLRSCFVAKPGYVLIESDYKSAEIVALAYITGDANLITDALGPVKLHAKVAVDVFGAPCSYEEVADLYPYYYVGAKNVNFGIPYQRGAKAIARQINRDTKGKANMTPEQAQLFIDSWYRRYQEVRTYVNYCDWCVNKRGYIDTPWGRRRHFYRVDSASVMAAQVREAVNFPIQSTVADCLNATLFNLWDYKRRRPEHSFNIVLAIHDAVLLEVPIEHIEPVIDYVLPLCMTHAVEVPATDRTPAFKLGTDREVYLRWGEAPTAADLQAVGVPEKYWPKEKVKNNGLQGSS